jgi:hypothetical protein
MRFHCLMQSGGMHIAYSRNERKLHGAQWSCIQIEYQQEAKPIYKTSIQFVLSQLELPIVPDSGHAQYATGTRGSKT